MPEREDGGEQVKGEREEERWGRAGRKRIKDEKRRGEGRKERRGKQGAGGGLRQAQASPGLGRTLPGWVNVCKMNQTELCPQRAQGTQPRSFRRGLSFRAHDRQACHLNAGCCLLPLKLLPWGHLG